MLRLRVLGGAAVEGTRGSLGGAAAQRKCLALLGLLAPAGEQGMSRDKILAYLWPEAGSDKAAHRLTQILYILRRDLQADDLFLGSTDLRLNPASMTSDVAEFDAARRGGEFDRAVSLYGGPFLDGFYVRGAPEFDQWVENERAGFAREYAEALETLAAEAALRGDHRRAAEWWRHLAECEPLSSRVTVHLMSALAAAGNRADAIERASAYQELIQRELDAAPNPAVMALAQQLRRPSLEPLQKSGEVAVAVLPFANLTPTGTNDHFVEGLVEELTTALGQIPGLRVAARMSVKAFKAQDLDAREIGRRLNVDLLLEGSVRQHGDRIRVTGQLIDVGDGCHLWSQRYERQVVDPFAVQDELAGMIVAGVQGPVTERRGRPVVGSG